MPSVNETASQIESASDSKPRCLLANDEPFLLLSFSQQLERHDILVTTVDDGLAAVQAVLDNPVDHFSFIILDINMPMMNGIEACKRIVNRFKTQRSSKEICYNPRARFESDDVSPNATDSNMVQFECIKRINRHSSQSSEGAGTNESSISLPS